MAETFKVVSATGHRPGAIPYESRQWLGEELPRVADKLVRQYGMQVGISGLALGADTWWARAVLGAGAQLWSYIPSPDQSRRWSPDEHRQWMELRHQASKECVFGPRYDVRLLHMRNRAMVDRSDLLVAVMAPHRTTGGTVTTVGYAQRCRRPLLLLDITARNTTLIRHLAASPTPTRSSKVVPHSSRA